MATIRIPTPLRPYAGGLTTIPVEGATVGAALTDLTTRYPALRAQLYDGDKLRSFVNVYLNQEDIRYLNGEATPLTADAALLIVPSIAGGRTAETAR